MMGTDSFVFLTFVKYCSYTCIVAHVCLMSSHPRFDNSLRWSQDRLGYEGSFPMVHAWGFHGISDTICLGVCDDHGLHSTHSTQVPVFFHVEKQHYLVRYKSYVFLHIVMCSMCTCTCLILRPP